MYIFNLRPRAATVQLRMRRFRVLALDIVNPDLRIFVGLNHRLVGRIENSGDDDQIDLHFDINVPAGDYNTTSLVRMLNRLVELETEIKQPIMDLNPAGLVVLRTGVILSGSEEASIASSLGYYENDVAYGTASFLPQNIYCYLRIQPHGKLYDEVKRKSEFAKHYVHAWSAEQTEHATLLMNGRLVALIYMGAPGFRSRRVVSTYISLQGTKNNFRSFELIRAGAPLYPLLRKTEEGPQVILATN